MRRISTASGTATPGLGRHRQPFEAHPRGGVGDQAVRAASWCCRARASPTWNSARPSGSSTGRTRSTASVVAADHEHEHPALGPDGSTGQGRLDEVVARAGRAGRPASRTDAGLLVDRSTRIDPGAADAGPGGGDRVDDRRGRQGQQRDLGGPDRRPRPRPRPSAPTIAAARPASTSCTDDVVAVGHQVGGDRPADVAQADHADRDVSHGLPPRLVTRPAAPVSSRATS